jgi:hypothetical protein
MKNVKLYWWSPKKYSKFSIIGRLNGEYYRYKNIPSNFGDELSEYIVSNVLSTKVIKASKEEKGKLLAIGSIIHQCKDGDIIWGSGVNGKYINKKIIAKSLTILGVRGPLTRSYLISCGYKVPEVYGDPAILTPLFYEGKNLESKSSFKYVPHFSEINNIDEKWKDNVILPTLHFKEVINQILINCEYKITKRNIADISLIALEMFGSMYYNCINPKEVHEGKSIKYLKGIQYSTQYANKMKDHYPQLKKRDVFGIINDILKKSKLFNQYMYCDRGWIYSPLLPEANSCRLFNITSNKDNSIIVNKDKLSYMILNTILLIVKFNCVTPLLS